MMPRDFVAETLLWSSEYGNSLFEAIHGVACLNSVLHSTILIGDVTEEGVTCLE